MLQILPKCTSYNVYAEKARNIIKYKYLIAFLPMLLSFILGIVLAFLVSFYFLILSAVGGLYCLIIIAVLSSQFKAYNLKIIEKFVGYYKPQQSALYAKILDDNKGISAKIMRGNPLLCWYERESLRYITSKIYRLNTLKLAGTNIAEFDNIISSDFGELYIPLNIIDHYRDTTLVCRYGAGVLRLKFADEKTLETFIAQKEYYFASNKKSWSNY